MKPTCIKRANAYSCDFQSCGVSRLSGSGIISLKSKLNYEKVHHSNCLFAILDCL